MLAGHKMLRTKNPIHELYVRNSPYMILLCHSRLLFVDVVFLKLQLLRIDLEIK